MRNLSTLNTVANTIEVVRSQQARTVETIASTLHHPRALARPSAAWRPPSVELPAVEEQHLPRLHAALTRYRLGPRAHQQLRASGMNDNAAYVISVRITHPRGSLVSSHAAQAWATVIAESLSHYPGMSCGCVHELHHGTSATYVWIVDQEFRPLGSPSAMFEGFVDAA